MKKTRQVVILPIEKAVQKGELFINKPKHLKDKLESHICERVTQHGHSWSGSGIKTEIQHLYILSDEEIKAGDWLIWDNNVYKHTAESFIGIPWHECKKIIATTDSSLGLPLISESFIKAYIKAYNEGNPITEVQVEYELQNVGERTEKVILKLKEDGSITIHRAKAYTEEDVKWIAKKAYNKGLENSTIKYFDIDKWIEKNL